MKKILEINLKDATYRKLEIEEKELKLNEYDLVFKAGELCGYNIVGVNKLFVYSQNIKASSGSDFAHYMKTNGYDYIIIKEKSRQPIYIYINKDFIKISNNLTSKLHENDVATAQVKQVGEQCLDFARIVFSSTKSCGKNGLGKIMGNKNLIAIMLNKCERLQPNDQQSFDRINNIIARSISDKNMDSHFNDRNQCYGCNLNCKTSVISKIEKIGFDNETANLINQLSNEYGIDSIIFSKVVKKYFVEDIPTSDKLKYFINEFINNYCKYRELYYNTLKEKKSSDINKVGYPKAPFKETLESLGFCKYIIEKAIINEKELDLLIETIQGR